MPATTERYPDEREQASYEEGLADGKAGKPQPRWHPWPNAYFRGYWEGAYLKEFGHEP